MVSPVLFETDFDLAELAPQKEPERTLMSYLDEVAENGGMRRLNLGMGGSGLISIRHPSVRLSAIVEEEPEFLEFLKHSPLQPYFDKLGVSIVRSRFSELPFRDEAFQVVTASDFLGKRVNIEAVIREIHRVTERFAIFSVPHKSSLGIPVLGFRKEHLYPEGSESSSPKEFQGLIEPYFKVRRMHSRVAGQWLTVLGKKIK